MPGILKKGRGVTDNALGWIGCVLVLAAAIILDKGSPPHKWHAAIEWTAAAFFGVLVFGRKKWRSLPFWLFWVACLMLHMFAMWLIFGQLLPRLILGTLYVIPIALIESLLLTIVFFWLTGKLGSTKDRSDSPRNAAQRE